MTLEEDRNYILTSGCIYFQNLDNLSLYQRQNQLDEAIHRMLDNEGVQKLIAAQSSASSSGSSDGQSEANTSRAKSPLSQAMLQIHSPDSVPDINIGETVVLQMEEGRATLIAHSDNGLLLDKHLETNSAQKLSGSDSDEVFDRDKDESEIKTSPTLHSVISNLISTRVATISSEEVNNEPVSKVENVAIRNVIEDSSVMQNTEQFSKSGQVEEREHDSKVVGLMSEKHKNSNGTAVIAGKVDGSPEATAKTAHSPKQKKSPAGELIVPQPNSPQIFRSQASAGSPAIAVSQPTSVQEKRRSHRGPSKIPHPAFNIPVTTFDRNGGLYNYNLPDRGLGSMMNSSPVPLSVSPPVVSAPRFPVTIATTVPGQVLGFMSPSWQMQRPLGHSPASNDSHSSGSPLDLSNVREASPNLPKVMNEVEVVAKEKPVNKQQLEQKQLSTSKSSPLITSSTKVVTVAKPDPSKEAVKQPSLVSTSKVPYTQEMLYLFDKELEIVAVGKNKWIVRNENELVNVVKKKTDSEPSGEITASTSNLDGADGTIAVPIQNGNSLNSTEENKRPLNSESGSHRSKVTKLVNGDVHTTVSSVQSKLSSEVSSVTNDTIPHSAVNLKTDKNLT